jgi:hypothetical protein
LFEEPEPKICDNTQNIFVLLYARVTHTPL